MVLCVRLLIITLLEDDKLALIVCSATRIYNGLKNKFSNILQNAKCITTAILTETLEAIFFNPSMFESVTFKEVPSHLIASAVAVIDSAANERRVNILVNCLFLFAGFRTIIVCSVEIAVTRKNTDRGQKVTFRSSLQGHLDISHNSMREHKQ